MCLRMLLRSVCCRQQSAWMDLAHVPVCNQPTHPPNSTTHPPTHPRLAWPRDAPVHVEHGVGVAGVPDALDRGEGDGRRLRELGVDAELQEVQVHLVLPVHRLEKGGHRPVGGVGGCGGGGRRGVGLDR